MRVGCAVLVTTTAVVCGLAAGSLWVGSRMLQEPEVPVAAGTAEDGVRGQQKIYAIIRGAGRATGRTRQIVLSEPELNGFLSRHLAEAATIPFGPGAVRLVGDGMIEFKGQVPLRHVLAIASLLPTTWLEQPVWLHLWARVSVEVGSARGQRRYLRLDIERFALGRQPLPGVLPVLLVNPVILSQLRLRIPETVEAITIETRMVVIRIAS
ncbi:MAG: hypothetical protein DMD95_08340 [Candidatus Rokuibacteriota bacterium]|nr:MAG: hypothetical protein DMD95_08340 [Candidatus Rokubacteria bacterium]